MAFGGRGRERGRGGIQVRIHFAPQYAAAARAVPGEAPWKKGEKDSHGAQLHAGLKFSLSAAAVAAAPPSPPRRRPTLLPPPLAPAEAVVHARRISINLLRGKR